MIVGRAVGIIVGTSVGLVVGTAVGFFVFLSSPSLPLSGILSGFFVGHGVGIAYCNIVGALVG